MLGLSSTMRIRFGMNADRLPAVNPLTHTANPVLLRLWPKKQRSDRRARLCSPRQNDSSGRMKVDIRPLQAERFARTQSRKRQHDKERAPRFVCERENRFDLGAREMCGDGEISFGEPNFANRYLPAR